MAGSEMLISPVKLMCDRCTFVAEQIGRLHMQLTMPTGVLVLGHEVIIRGLCRDCSLLSLPSSRK